MGSGAVMYVPSFINIGSGIQKLIGRGYTERETHTHTHTYGQQCDLLSLLYFFQNKESRLKIIAKYRNRLNAAPYLRIQLSSTKRNIKIICEEKKTTPRT
jgi:hypothetical protein